MSKWPKIFLVMSVVTFGIGLTSVGSSIAYGILKPTGAILFIVFYISQLLDKEVAQYDEEHRSKISIRKSGVLASTHAETNNRPSGQAHQGAALVAGPSC